MRDLGTHLLQETASVRTPGRRMLPRSLARLVQWSVGAMLTRSWLSEVSELATGKNGAASACGIPRSTFAGAQRIAAVPGGTMAGHGPSVDR